MPVSVRRTHWVLRLAYREIAPLPAGRAESAGNWGLFLGKWRKLQNLGGMGGICSENGGLGKWGVRRGGSQVTRDDGRLGPQKGGGGCGG